MGGWWVGGGWVVGGWLQIRFYNPLWLSSELSLDSESKFEPSVAIWLKCQSRLAAGWLAEKKLPDTLHTTSRLLLQTLLTLFVNGQTCRQGLWGINGKYVSSQTELAGRVGSGRSGRFLQKILPLRGSILQAGTCQILS